MEVRAEREAPRTARAAVGFLREEAVEAEAQRGPEVEVPAAVVRVKAVQVVAAPAAAVRVEAAPAAEILVAEEAVAAPGLPGAEDLEGPAEAA